MRKLLKYLAFFVALAFVFTSCTKDEELTGKSIFKGTERSAGDDGNDGDNTSGPSNLPSGGASLPPIVDDEDDENDDDANTIVDDEDDENDDDKPKK
jgi:hypothetical protein